MPRRRSLGPTEFPYHVTARGNNRENFPGDLSFAWKVFTDELYLQTVLTRCTVHAFVLMPNHFHLLISTGATPLATLMQNVLSSSTRVINTRARRTGHLFGGRHYWSLITDPLYYAHAFKYVYRNPVKAGLCERVEDYPFSTYHSLWGNAPLPMPISKPRNSLARLVPNSFEETSEWLNEATPTEESAAIQKALRRKTFKLPNDRKTRKPFRLTEIAIKS